MLRRLSSKLLFLTVPGPLLCAQQQARPHTPPPAGSHYVEREFRMPVPGSEPLGLDVLEVYVDTPGKHPLALLTHGTSAEPEERMQMTPWGLLPQAFWFAERGYVALVIIRRGYGISGGKQDTLSGGCRGVGTFTEAGETSADDLRNAVTYAEKSLPEADTSIVVSAGVSTGGFAQVALAAHPPGGLKAAINFAGGRGGDGKGNLCDEGGLVSAFRGFGKKARTPMLWIYAENDKWFPPAFAHKFEEAFQSKGGVDQFVLAPPNGADGHGLFHRPLFWSETVESFLREQKLLPVDPSYPAPTPPKVDPPPGLQGRGLDAFQSFLIMGPYKAFASDGAGHFGYSVGNFTQQIADKHALDFCNQGPKGAAPCAIVARGSQR